jgi:hypothetical protein
MCHHHIDSREVGDGVFSDGGSVGCRLVGGVVAVLVAEVGEGVVAEFGLVGGRVDLIEVLSVERSIWSRI